jgi:hypothetical protein
MNEPAATDRTITDRITGLVNAAAGARGGTLSPQDANAAVIAADEVIAALGLLAFPATHSDERLEQVVVTVHGIDVSIRGRPGDVFVHVEDQRDDQDRAAVPLTVEVNHAGEVSYAEDNHHAVPLGGEGPGDGTGRGR